MNVTLVLIVLIVLILSWFWLTKRRTNYPPSPGVALPFIGHLYLMKPNPRQQFKDWAKTLGDVFSLQMGNMSVVVISSYDTIKETFVKKADAFSGRPLTDFINVHLPLRRRGIAFSSGNFWKTQRTTSLTILRTLGMGKNILAEKITEEASSAVDEISRNRGEPTYLKPIIYNSVTNVIASIIFGKRFNYNDPKFVSYMNLSSTASKLFNGVTLINYWHFLKYVPFDLFQAKKLVNTITELEKITESLIQEAIESNQPQKLDNFINLYLDEMKKMKSNDLDLTAMARAIDDLFGAGSETTATTILWCILYTLHYPDIQEKIYNEIVEQVGTNRVPTILDKPKLKYLNAFMMETQRKASIIPFGVIHMCTEDSTIRGFSIPKGTSIMSNLDCVLHDEQIWGDPQTFRPERFLDVNGSLISREELIPFSTGRRACVGEGLAKMELYILMAILFQTFQFVPVDSNNLPPLEEDFGITAPPLPYQVKCIERMPAIGENN